MKKTLNINLGGFNFHIDEDAFSKLEHYLATLKQQFSKTKGGEEIVNDVEMRIAELFKEYTANKEVVDLQDVAQAISVLGEPEDYIDSEAEATDEETSFENTSIPPHLKSSRKVYRDADDRILGGVAAGLAAYFNIDSLWVRLVFVALFFAGFGIFLYVILWIVVPKAKTTAEKLQMRGEPVTLSNIEKAIKEEASQLGKNFKSFSQEARSIGRSGQKKAGTFISDFGQLLGDIFRLTFKVISKVLGFLLLALGFIFLFSILIAFITGTAEINGIGYGLGDVFAFVEKIAASSGHYNAGLIGISLLVLSPLFLLVYYGIRILFKVEPLNKQVRGSLALLTVVGIALTIYAGVRTAIEFKKKSEFTRTVELPKSQKTLSVALLKDSIYEDFASYDFEAHWQQYGNLDAFYGVSFDVRQSSGSTSYLQIRTSAHASNRKQAIVNAQKVNYPVLLESNQLVLPLYYLLQDQEKFRGQEVNLTLFLVPGDTIRLERGMEQIIDDIRNINNYYDWDMINHTWLMTENGLLCADCPDTEAALEEQRKRKIDEEQQIEKVKALEKIEQERKNTTIEINEDGITVKKVSAIKHLNKQQDFSINVPRGAYLEFI